MLSHILPFRPSRSTFPFLSSGQKVGQVGGGRLLKTAHPLLFLDPFPPTSPLLSQLSTMMETTLDHTSSSSAHFRPLEDLEFPLYEDAPTGRTSSQSSASPRTPSGCDSPPANVLTESSEHIFQYEDSDSLDWRGLFLYGYLEGSTHCNSPGTPHSPTHEANPPVTIGSPNFPDEQLTKPDLGMQWDEASRAIHDPWEYFQSSEIERPSPGVSADATHSGIISRNDGGPPPETLPALLFCILISMNTLRMETSSAYPSYSQQGRRLLPPPEDDDEVIFVKSVPRTPKNRKRPRDPSNDAYPTKRARATSSKINVLATQMTWHFYDGDRTYVCDRKEKSWRDEQDGTCILVRFDEDYKMLTLKVHPHGLSGMPVRLSWNEEEGMFCGYDVAGAHRLVPKDVVSQLIESPGESQEIEWPQVE